MRTVELKGVLYTEQPCVGENTCEGCAGDNKEKGGEGICWRLPLGCSSDGGIIWVRHVPTPTAYEGVAESLTKQFEQPEPQAPIIIDEAELQCAVEDYQRARAEGIV